MTFTEALDCFENYQRNILGRSENTIISYKCDLLCFARDVGVTSIDISKSCAEKYISKLTEQGTAESTRARKITALQMFYKYLYEEEYIGENPMQKLVKPKIPQKKILVMTGEEVKQVLDTLHNRNKNGKDYFRNLTLIYVFLSTGIRRNELINIHLDDVNLAENSLLVREGKGNKQRIVYFNDTTKALLSEYMASHRKLLKYAEDSDYLFVSNCSEKLSKATVNIIVNKLYEEAGVKDKGYTVHSLRKAFATTVYGLTKDIVTVQNLLGHASPQTTMRYVLANEETKKQAVQLVNF